MYIESETAILAKEKGFKDCVESCYHLVDGKYWEFLQNSAMVDYNDNEYDSERGEYGMWISHGEYDRSFYIPTINYNTSYDVYYLSAPTQTNLKDWLFKTHKIYVYVQYDMFMFQYVIKWKDKVYLEQYGSGSENEQEEFEKGLFNALKLIKNEC